MSIIFFILAGILVGVLINYFSDVLPATRNLTHPACNNCGADYSILDYLLFNRCLNCGNKKPIRSIVVVTISVLACVMQKFFPFSNLYFFALLPILILMGVIVVIDMEHRLVLIQTSLFGLFLFFVYGILMNGIIVTVKGGLAGLLIMLAFYFAGSLFIFISGKLSGKEIDEVAFGLGDVFFGTILGLLVGYPLIIGAVILTMLLLVIFSLLLFLFLILKGKYRAFSLTLPFTTFQVLGALVILYL